MHNTFDSNSKTNQIAGKDRRRRSQTTSWCLFADKSMWCNVRLELEEDILRVIFGTAAVTQIRAFLSSLSLLIGLHDDVRRIFIDNLPQLKFYNVWWCCNWCGTQSLLITSMYLYEKRRIWPTAINWLQQNPQRRIIFFSAASFFSSSWQCAGDTQVNYLPVDLCLLLPKVDKDE